MPADKVNINMGSGGREMHNFINAYLVEKLKNGILEKLDDSAILENPGHLKIAMTTDSYVVSPIFFEGGDIGRLCVCGTVNDLATSGSKPIALSLAFIMEEGFQFEHLKKVIDSIARTADEAGVKIVTGDTKVVEKGKGDQIFINTCGIGFIESGVNISSHNARENDEIIITGPIGNHEIALLKARQNFGFETFVKSDVAPLNKYIETLLKKTKAIHAIKDPTRGGLATALTEIAAHSNCEILIKETEIPVEKEVTAVCELIGYDPLYLANEGKYVIIAPKSSTSEILETFGSGAKVIGKVSSIGRSGVILTTKAGGYRRLTMLETTQLPRIC